MEEEQRWWRESACSWESERRSGDEEGTVRMYARCRVVEEEAERSATLGKE